MEHAIPPIEDEFEKYYRTTVLVLGELFARILTVATLPRQPLSVRAVPLSVRAFSLLRVSRTSQ
jgi:hypothetical protein